MKGALAAVALVLLALMVLACGDGPESCGRKDIVRYKPHGVVEHCVDGHWKAD